MASDLSLALERFQGDNSADSNRAADWLRRFFLRRAFNIMSYTDKTGAQRSVPPVATSADAQDVAAEMLLKLLVCRRQLGKTIPVRYAMGVWRNVRVNWYSKQCRQQRGARKLAPETDPHDGAVQPAQRPERPTRSFRDSLAAYRAAHDRQELRQAFEALRAKSTGPRQQGFEVLEHRYRFGMTYQELASLWGVPEGTLKSQAFDALRSLKRELGGV